MTIEIKTTAGEIFEGSSVTEALQEIVKSCEENGNFLVEIKSINDNIKLDHLIPNKQYELDYALDKAREEHEKNISEDDPLLKKAISEVEKNKIVHANYLTFMSTGEGTNKYPTDPTDPRSWGQKGNPSKWFVESDEGKNYMQEKAITTKELNEKFMLKD